MGKPHFSRATSCIQQQTLELGAVLQALDLLDVLGPGWERPGCQAARLCAIHGIHGRIIHGGSVTRRTKMRMIRMIPQ